MGLNGQVLVLSPVFAQSHTANSNREGELLTYFNN